MQPLAPCEALACALVVKGTLAIVIVSNIDKLKPEDATTILDSLAIE